MKQFTLEQLTENGFCLVGEGFNKQTICMHNQQIGKGYLLKIEDNYLIKQSEYEIPIRYDLKVD